MIDLEAVRQSLAALGPDADAVAERLVAANHRGLRGIPWACPVAQHLHASAGVSTRVCREVIFVPDPDCLKAPDRLPVPVPVRDFIGRFDEGHYPELLDEGTTP